MRVNDKTRKSGRILVNQLTRFLPDFGFYNAVISKRIAKELEIDLLEPYIAVQTINTSGAFVAKKAKTFKEEKKVADKAPVDGITIENLGDTWFIKQAKKKP